MTIKFKAEQVESIISKAVPLIDNPEDYEYFRAVLHCYALEPTSGAQFSNFVATLLKN